MPIPAIRTDQLSKHYGAVRALDGLNLTVNAVVATDHHDVHIA
ncbi:ABC-type sugar transport system ATPase subunit [Micromonospora sp. A200]|nr:hypothetical protein [Micromonospora sp. A200]MDH6462696.1 ABC-type sugar transport system ATPase subunit [Micromonospora sp. A200]